MEYCDECIWKIIYTPWGTPFGVPVCTVEDCSNLQPSGQIYENNNDETEESL